MTNREAKQSLDFLYFLIITVVTLLVMVTVKGQGDLHPAQFLGAFGVGFMALMVKNRIN